MKRTFWLANCALGVAAALLGPGAGNVHARGREGGFSRESPAAAGGFASHSGSAQRSQGSAQSSRQQYAARAQTSREQTATGMQTSREQTATGMQTSAQYHRAYPYAAATYPAWDAGARVAAVATGAAIGAAAASSQAPPATPVYVSAPACASPAVIPVGSMTYFQCGSSWYTQGYGPNGPTFVVVAPPPGY